MRALLISCIALAACGGGDDVSGVHGPDYDGGGTPGHVGPPDGQDGGPVIPRESGTPGTPDTGSDATTPDAGAGVTLAISASKQDNVPKAGMNPLVMTQALDADTGGNTSARFQSNKPIQGNFYPVGAPNNNPLVKPSDRQAMQRDRDLGQTFLTGAQGFKLDAVYLRLGFDTQAVVAGAPGSKLAIEFFQVDGNPTVNDCGTPGFLKDGNGKPIFDRAKSPQLDDYLDGETYTPLWVAEATLPSQLGAGDFLTFKLSGGDQLVLKAHTSYGFVVGFVDNAADRSLALANAYWGSYQPDPTRPLVGHGIRREGGSGMAQSPFFSPDLPADAKIRRAKAPGTLGFPDVDTWRDLYFTIAAVPGSLQP